MGKGMAYEKTNIESSFSFLRDELRLKDKVAFRGYLRMDENCFIEILNLVKVAIIKKKNTEPQENPSGVWNTKHEFHCLLFRKQYQMCVPLNEYLKFPTTVNEWKTIAENFFIRWQFPLCIGALDGKHVAFRASKADGAMYHNYKGFDSIVLLALTDYTYKFIFVDIGCNGRISDGGVFHRSDLRHIINEPQQFLPPDEIIGNQRLLPYSIVCDDAFALEKDLLKPYPFNSVEKAKRVFNFRLSHARQTVEHSFGMLANRFRVLQTKIHLRPEKVKKITQATCVLHNFLMSKNDSYIDVNKKQTSTTPSRQPNDTGPTPSRNYSRLAGEIRNQFAEYFSLEGALPWQDQYI